MYNVTEDFKRDIFAASRLFDIEVKIGDLVFDKESVSSVKFEGGVQPREHFELGSTVSTTVKIELFTDRPITDTDEISIRIALWVERKVNGVIIHEWEWVPMGHFFIDELEEPERGTISITACDAMIKTEIAFLGKDYVTLRDVARLVTTQTGIAFTDEIPAEKVSTLLTEYSIRGVLSFIASMMGGFMTIDRNGQFKVAKPLAKSVGLVDGDCYFTSKPEKTAFTIGKITCVLGTDNDGKESKLEAGILESGTKEIQFENPWMTQRVLDSILKEYSEFQYSGYTLDLQGNPAFDACDIVILRDTSGTQYDLPIFWWTLEFNGGLSGTISAKGATELKNSFDSKGSGQKELEKVVAQQGVFNELTAETLKVHSGMFDEIKAGTGEFENLYVKYAEFDVILGNSAVFLQVKADAAKFGVIEGDVAVLKDILNGNITSENIHSLILSAGKVTAEESFVKEQIAAKIYVQDLLAGDISTNKFRIISDSGRLLMQDNTIQIKDMTRVRVQIGKDASGDYSMYVWDASGNLMFDALGLKASGIKDKIIRDDMVADNACINGSKIDISSLVTEINNGTTNIKSSKILYDPTGQVLSVAFRNLSTSVSDISSVVASQETSIKAIQGSIEVLISDTVIIEGGQSKKLKDVYASLKLSVNGLSSTVSEHTSRIGAIDGKFADYVTSEAMKSAIEQSAGGILSTVSQTYVTEDAMGKAFGFYWSASETATAINQKADSITLSVSQTYATKDSVNGLSTRVSSAELALEPDKIVAKVQSGIVDKNGKIQTANYILDATGMRIYNGSLQMYKGTGGAIQPSLYFDTMMDRYVFSGHIVANTGTFGGGLSAASGTFGGSVEIYNGTRPLYKLNSSGLNVYASQVAVEGFQVGSMYDFYNSTAFAFEIRNPQQNGHLRLSAGNNVALVTGQYGFMMSSGQKSRAVSTDYGIACISAYETPEPSFGDYGSGALDKSGECVIFIDPVFIQTVSPECGYQVFVQKYGRGDIWVEERTQEYFIIKGTAGLKFGWNAVFHQKGYELDRAEIVDIPIDNYSETFTDEALCDQIDYEKEAYEYLQEVS